jgi:hypothetical protein
MSISGDPGVRVGQFSLIATAYGAEVKQDVRQVSWYSWRSASRRLNVHAQYDSYQRQAWLQNANIAYLFTLKSLVGQGIVIGMGDDYTRLYSQSSWLRTSLKTLPATQSYSKTGLATGAHPVILANTYTPNSYPDTFVCNVFNLNTKDGTFRVRVGRSDQHRIGWGDNDIRVVYAAFKPNAHLLTNDILASGEIQLPKPASSGKRTFSSVTLEHNLNRLDYQCLAGIRIDTVSDPEFSFAVECQAGTANTITFMAAELELRAWNRYSANVFVSYLLIPVVGAPVIKPDHFSGIPTIVG